MILNKALLKLIKKLPKKSIIKKKHLRLSASRNDRIYVVLQGCLKCYYINDEGKEIIRSFHLPGDIVGLNRLYNRLAHFNIQAIADSKVAIIRKSALSDPALLEECLKQSVMREKECSLILSAPTLKARIATFFIIYIHHSIQKYGDSTHFDLPINMVDLSKHLSITHESLSRFLSELKKKKILHIEKHMIANYNMRELAEIANIAESPEIISEDIILE